MSPSILNSITLLFATIISISVSTKSHVVIKDIETWNTTRRIEYVKSNCPEVFEQYKEQEILTTIEENLRGPLIETLGFACLFAVPQQYLDTGNRTLIRHKRGGGGSKPIFGSGASDRKPNVPLKPIQYEVDWRQSGHVSPVQDQKRCGACWAFAVVGAIEAQVKRSTGKLTPLSAQHLVDCAHRINGCSGGAAVLGFTFLVNKKGLATAADYPYKGKKGKCNEQVKTVPFQLRNWRDGRRNDDADLQKKLATVGPMVARISTTELKNYKRGIYRCKKYKANTHAILIVGYGTDPNTNEKFWLVKNSWGTRWGEQGYVRLIRGEGYAAACGLTTEVTYLEF